MTSTQEALHLAKAMVNVDVTDDRHAQSIIDRLASAVLVQAERLVLLEPVYEAAREWEAMDAFPYEDDLRSVYEDKLRDAVSAVQNARKVKQ